MNVPRPDDTQHRAPDQTQVFSAWQFHDAGANAIDDTLGGHALIEQLGDRKQADQNGYEIEPLGKLITAERKPLDPGGQVNADRAEENADAARNQVTQR